MPNGTERQGPRSLGDHGREIQHDVQALVADVRDAAVDVRRYVTTQVEQRPYTTLGVAAAVGYVLGGGLRAPLTVALLGTATRLGVALAARELVARLSPGANTSVQSKSS